MAWFGWRHARYDSIAITILRIVVVSFVLWCSGPKTFLCNVNVFRRSVPLSATFPSRIKTSPRSDAECNVVGCFGPYTLCCLRNSHVQTAKLQHSCFGCGVHSKCLPSRCDVTNGRYSGLPVGAAKEPLNRLDTPCVGGYHRLRLPVLESKKILLLLRRTFYFELLYDVARQESNRWSRFFVLRAAAHFPGF